MTDPDEPSIEKKVVRRYARLVGFSILAALLACLLMVFEGILRLTGFWPPSRLDVSVIVGILVGLAIMRRGAAWSWVHPTLRSNLRRWAERADDFASWAMIGNRPATVISALIAILVATWAPHYLTWPFWTDHDVLATLALGWDRGQLPWRDQIGFQFPGEIELFWALGRGAGWGSSLAFYAADLALLGVLLGTVAVSCRACLGRWLPGLAACLAILGYYVTLVFTLAAQRDWHAAELAAIALMLLVAGRSWRLRLASSLAFAMALTIRPHAIVFLPAIGFALMVPPRGGTGGRAAALVWLGGLAVGLLATFSPVVLSGLTGDFLHAMGFVRRSGGPYASSSLDRSWRSLTLELGDHWSLALGAMLLALTWLGGTSPSRRLAAVLLAAVGCAMLYRPLHPIDHAYLRQPLQLFQALAFASLADGMVEIGVADRTRLAAFILLIDLAMPWWNSLCDVRASFAAIGALASGSEPAKAPPGCALGFPSGGHPAYPYDWRDYIAALDYLRSHTDSSTPVANLLTYFPYPSVNASVGRVTPLPVETISLVHWFPDVDFDTLIASALEGSPDAVVACDAGLAEGNFAKRLTRTLETMDRSYKPVARFGAIEIRRRSPRPGG